VTFSRFAFSSSFLIASVRSTSVGADGFFAGFVATTFDFLAGGYKKMCN